MQKSIDFLYSRSKLRIWNYIQNTIFISIKKEKYLYTNLTKYVQFPQYNQQLFNSKQRDSVWVSFPESTAQKLPPAWSSVHLEPSTPHNEKHHGNLWFLMMAFFLNLPSKKKLYCKAVKLSEPTDWIFGLSMYDSQPFSFNYTDNTKYNFDKIYFNY